MRRTQAIVLLSLSIALLPLSAARGQDIADELNRSITITALAGDDGWQKDLSNPYSLFYDHYADEVFVADAGNHRIVIYDADLIPRFTFDHYVPEQSSGRIVRGEPRGVAVNSFGEIIVMDNLVSYLDVHDYRGKWLDRIEPARLLGDTTLVVQPRCLAIDDQDNLYVAVMGDVVTILVLDQEFRLVRRIGQQGTGPADMNTPMAMTVADGKLFVTDLYAVPAIKVYSIDGTFLRGFSGHDIDRTDVSFPSGIAIMHGVLGDYTIWVVDGLRQVIKVFYPDGTFAAHVGGFGVKPGEFRYPADIVAGKDATYYVLERVGARVQRCEIRLQ